MFSIKRKAPYHHDLNQPMLRYGSNTLFLKGFFEGIFVTGSTGSGKTSGSGAYIREALLRSGAGILVLCVKPDERDAWTQAAKKAGRGTDLAFIDASPQSERFSILDYFAATFAANGFDRNLLLLMERLSEALGVAKGGGSGSDDSYWENAAMRGFSNVFPLLRAAKGTIRISDVYQMIVSAPKRPEQDKDPKWQKHSFCWQVLKTLILRGKSGDKHALTLLQTHGDYWLEELPSLAPRTRSCIESHMLTTIAPLLTGKLNEILCQDTTIVPEMLRRDGKILIVDLPVLAYGPEGAAAQAIIKYVFGLALQRQKLEKNARPVAIFADEYQALISRFDADLLATCRSSKICFTALTQDLPKLYAQLGHNKRDLVEAVIATFGTRIYHCNTCRQTNQHAAETIGKMQRYNTSRNTSWGSNSGGSLNQHEESGGSGAGDGRSQSYSEGVQSYRDFVIPPEYFAKELRTGAKKNRYFVDAILVRNGRNFKATGEHWMKVTYRQGEYG